MKLTKKQEKEILQVYHSYWDSYLKGNVEAMHPLLADEYTQVGSAESEVFSNKKDAVQFLYNTIEQVAGKLEMRNRKTILEQQDHTVLVHEFCDLYALAEGNWIFYSRFRASTFMQQKKEGWKIIHQHSSFPDAKAEDGENIAIDKIAAENQQLREAIKRRTIELEQKNRELEIETALEKVRAEAMGMKKPDDILTICKIMFTELQSLGFSEIRNTLINFWDDDNSSLIDYDYSDVTGGNKAKLSYSSHPVFEQFQKKIKNSQNAFAELVVTKDELESWKQRRRDSGEYEDARLNNIPALYYYFYSIGVGAIGISTFSSITEEKLNVLKRFRNVFDFAYRRYADVAQAEAQTREAQIEVAVERVRAKSLAMHRSEDLHGVVVALKKELLGLNIYGVSAVTMYLEQEDGSIRGIDLSGLTDGEEEGSAFKMDKVFRLEDTDPDLWIRKIWNGKEKYFVVEADEADFDRIIKWLYTLHEKEAAIAERIIKDEGIKKAWLATVTLEKGKLNIDLLEPPTPEIESILVKMGAAFDLAYTRFLDLQKAEAQTKEAQIEAAIEKVRSSSLAMHHSTELEQVAGSLFDRLAELALSFDGALIFIFDKEKRNISLWIATNHLSAPVKIDLPYDHAFENNKILKDLWNAIENGEHIINRSYTGEVKNEYFRYVAKYNESKIPESIRQFQIDQESWTVHLVAEKNSMICFDSWSGHPTKQEDFKILIRFAKVFEQAYTRFVDLQKAEAQAREAQIELGLERVRSRAMAMQKSDELSELVDTVFKELTKLDFALTWCIINIIDESSMSNTVWAANPEINKAPESYHMLFEDYPFHDAMMKGWKERKTKQVYTLEGSEKKMYDDYLFSETEFKRTPEAAQAASRAMEKYVVSFSFSNFGGLQTVGDVPLSEANLDILSRFGKVFDLTYTRFNDLKQAEAQARESQIQLALERVRAKTMAMQKSNELTDVAGLLFEQVSALGIKTWTAGFNVWSEDNDSYVDYITSPNGGFIEPYIVHTEKAEALKDISNARKSGVEFDVQYVEGEKIKQLYLALTKLDEKQYEIMLQDGVRFPSHQYEHFVFGSKVSLMFITYEPVPEAHDIFKRLGKVFEQTYTRFLDLQKAEAQAREAEIELSLERVRSRSMAMHKSDELLEAGEIIFVEMQKLGIESLTAGYVLIDKEEKNGLNYTPHPGTKKIMPVPVIIPHNETIHMQQVIENWKKGNPFFIIEMDEEETIKHQTFIAERSTNFPITAAQLIAISPAKLFLHNFYFKEGYVLIVGGTKLSVEQTDIMLRFAKVFQQTYTRFLDLQKAEAQAREAKIETALEKVRSRTMAMQKSIELGDVATVLFKEMNQLVDNLWTCGFVLCEKDRAEDEWWLSTETGFIPAFYLPNTGDRVHQNLYTGWKNGEIYRAEQIEGAELDQHYEWLMNIPVTKKIFDDMAAAGFQNPIWQKLHAAYFSKGYLCIITRVPCPEEEIFKRFAQVFDLTYTRFLDLQKAEAQTKEAKIEAALEKVRSRTLAMQQSSELGEVATELFKQMNQLVDNLWTCGFVLCEKNRAEDEWWLSTESGFIPSFYLPNTGDRVHENLFNGWKNEENFRAEQVEGAELKQHYEWLMNIPVTKQIFDDMAAAGYSKPDWQKLHAAYFSKGYLVIITQVPCAEEEVFKRFAQVFDLTYTRFLDLQKAEFQTRQAKIETALEKVRARALAMQQPEELTEVAHVMRHEMGLLGVEELETSSIYIHEENADKAECWYAIKDILVHEKKLLADHFILNLQDTWVGRQMLAFYQSTEKQVSIPMQGANRTEWINYCSGQSKLLEGFYGDNIPDRTYHLYKFSSGTIGAATPGNISAESWELLQRAASVFSLAYSRFKDLIQARIGLQKLKEEKQRAEDALTELQTTQKQLIQAEKMASLGELTAGIAHEIQNPLNFVNNFSEVSKELLDEMKEAIEKGDTEEAKEIMNDVIQNLEKINHHGKRADGIVKGMLQHSSSGIGKKEPTDINKLADEYLRLAYHGLRAKDKSFNATMKTDFDKSIGNMNIIPQDIGRVILNLITNAFYAVDQKKRNEDSHYKPTVTVSTKVLKPPSGSLGVLVSVSDNGNGIPQKVLDKIFQPFFTTKPTGQGTGLGLSLSYDIVKAHGGEMKVETMENEGSSFILILPQ